MTETINTTPRASHVIPLSILVAILDLETQAVTAASTYQPRVDTVAHLEAVAKCGALRDNLAQLILDAGVKP